MAFYTDPRFLVRSERTVILNGTVGTTTASGTNTLTDVFAATAAQSLPKYIRRTQIHAIRVRTITAPAANLTGSKLIFKNGTDAIGTVTVAAAGTFADATVTDSNAILAADAQPTVTYLGTATASAMAPGVYQVIFNEGELYA